MPIIEVDSVRVCPNANFQTADLLRHIGRSSRHGVVVDDNSDAGLRRAQLDLGALGESGLGKGQCSVEACRLALRQATILLPLRNGLGLLVVAWAQLPVDSWNWQGCLKRINVSTHTGPLETRMANGRKRLTGSLRTADR